MAKDCPILAPYIRDVEPILARSLSAGRRVIIEGSQGFGLSILHGGAYPHATSRDTTAATFLGEAALSPFEVDDITLVIRAFPIRVAGTSGPLKNEIDWPTIARQAGLPKGYIERTTATGKIRRVGRFDPDIVRRAIAANAPTRLVLNHFDYVGPDVRLGEFGTVARTFLEDSVEAAIGRRVDWLGIGPAACIERGTVRFARSAAIPSVA